MRYVALRGKYLEAMLQLLLLLAVTAGIQDCSNFRYAGIARTRVQ